MTTEGDVMRMREVPVIDLPAGQEVQLRHGQRYHLMLINLRQPLKVGDRFDLTLKFEKAGETTVKAWVQQPRAGRRPQATKGTKGTNTERLIPCARNLRGEHQGFRPPPKTSAATTSI